MPLSFWIKRSLYIFVMVAGLLLVVYLLRGRTLERSLIEATVWASITATVFVATRLVRLRRGEHCALCQDPSEQ